jgi:glycosyltransferase involved in cell wall biosynthesis
MIIDVVIPAYNEELSIGRVVADVVQLRGRVNFELRHVIVVNNNSTDSTVAVAQNAGAVVLTETEQGYGAACLKGIAWSNEQSVKADIIAFMDGDYSDHAEELAMIVAPILADSADMVIGSRTLGNREKGSLTPQQLFGNALATFLMRIIYRHRFTDLGPFRAIKTEALQSLGMRDRNYGWTIEMQIKALKKKLRCTEVPVSYRQRIGISKVSGTVKGTILAGYKILLTIFRHVL